PHSYILSTSCYAVHPDRHSFPTRRSSDLAGSRDLSSVCCRRTSCLPDLSIESGFGREPDEGADRKMRRRQRVGRSPKSGIRPARDRKSTRLNSSHVKISYAVFCLKKKKTT